MALDDMLVSFAPLFLVIADTVIDFSSSSSKVLTTKVDELESKMVALKVSVESVLERLNHLCSGLDITTANAAMFSDKFIVSIKFLDLDAMWDVVYKIMTLSANKIFKKK
ncbi:hypothetical protein G9A89_009755 [Geosiphon pyriformis]|nr:hypothetical protein G9A89_009755 [Geosiphon pyriformis]